MSDQELGRLLRGAGASEHRSTTECPSDEEIAGFVGGQLSVDRSTELRRHFAGCGYCLRQLGFLTRAEREVVLDDRPSEHLVALAGSLVEPQETAAPAGQHTWSGLAAAAGLAAMLVAALWIPRARDHEPREVRGASSARRGPVILSPEEGATVSGSGLEIRWQAVETALSYRVLVMNSSGDLVWQAKTSSTHLEIPAEIDLTRGRQYFVWVKALLPDVRTIKSETIGFVVGSGS